MKAKNPLIGSPGLGNLGVILGDIVTSICILLNRFERLSFGCFPLRSLWLVAGCLIIFAGNGRSAPIQTIRAIPIQIVNTNAGRVRTAHADLYDGKVYIGGLVYRPSSPAIGPHVHVWGVDKNNRLVFFKTTSVLITGKPSFIFSESYVVSLSPAVFDKATIIYVTFHSQSDTQYKQDFN